MSIVLGENADLLFVEKRAGQPVFPWHSRPTWADQDARSVAEVLAQARPEQKGVSWPKGFDCGILHRLDVSTSGVLVVSRRLDAFEPTRLLFAERRLTKRYFFYTDRDVPWDAHTEQAQLAHHPKNRKKMVAQRSPNTSKRGRWIPAITHFRRVHAGLWEARIPTGVMHQIRVHAQSVGLPLYGDTLYGGTALPEAWSTTHPGVSFFLHAAQIASAQWTSPTLDLPTWWPGANERGALDK